LCVSCFLLIMAGDIEIFQLNKLHPHIQGIIPQLTSYAGE
jgi:hypothetical protein